MDGCNVLCVVGPTASGKTAAAVELACLLNGEVISCDSVQLYRGFDIGTAKPAPAERLGIPHHMIDVAEPDEVWSAGQYAREALACVRDIASRGKLPIIAGGSGFYLRALTDGLIGLPPADCRFVIVGLCPTREHLLERIGLRADAMLREGLFAETEALLARGVPENCTPMCSIGYVQARAFLAGSLTEQEARSEIILRTRQYAKRQRTWFFNQTKVLWFEKNGPELIKRVENLLDL